MGIEIIFGVAQLALGVINGINQYSAGQEAAGYARQSADAQRERNNIEIANQGVIAVEDRRQRVREERVRRASMLAASENSGTSKSSGEIGGVSALRSNFGTLLSQSSSQTKANQGINAYNQKALDFDTKARVRTAEADSFSSFLNIFSSSIDTIGRIPRN